MIIKEYEKPPTWVRMNGLGGTDTPDPIESAELELENAAKPALQEPAIVHPFNTSIIKIRNNGMIDLFVGTDQGIRMDPYTETINVITDTLKWHLSCFKAWIEEDAQWNAKMDFMFNSEEGSFGVKAKKDINLNCEGNISISCKGNLDIQCEGDMNISGAGSGLSMAGNAVNFSSQGGTTTEEGNSVITSGSSSVMIDGKGIARIGDTITAS